MLEDQQRADLPASEQLARLAAANLQESETRFRALADSAPVPIWVNGVNAGCEFVNKAYLDFFGKTLAEVQGFGWQPHAHPEDEERYVAAYLAAFEARAPFRCQARFRDAKDEYRWLDSVGQPRFAPSGEFLGYVGASPDITETKRVELNGQFINQLDLELSRTSDPDQIVFVATKSLGAYLGVRACHVSEMDVAAGLAIIRAKWEGWLREAPSFAGKYRIDDFISRPFREALAAGEAAIIEDVTTDPRTQPLAATHEALGARASASVPILQEKQWRATLTVVAPHARRWRADEVQLVRDVAARVWLAVTKARSLEALRESERRARRTLTDQMLVGVASADTTGRLTMVNRRYCEITGYAEAELLGMRVADLTHPDDWPDNAELYRRLFETGDGFFLEKRYRRKGGDEIWVDTQTSALRDAQGNFESSVSVVVDVTDRKRVEQELAAAKDRLAADLIAKQAAYERADAATRAKDEFLAVVSHELRNPLSAILLHGQILHAEADNPASVREVARMIERSAKAQAQIIDDLLDTTRIISGKLKLELRAVNVASVVARAVEVVRPSARAKGIGVGLQLESAGAEITGDPNRLEQVFWNLLSNAVKFSEIGGRVDVVLRHRGAEIEIEVHDDGHGMEADVLDHIFERFWQSDMSSRRRAGGLGLGLPLVKHLVELHGGTVAAASAGRGQGATFTVRLPLQPSSAAPAEERAAGDAGAAQGTETLVGLRILVVDDDEDMRAVLALTLRRYGAEAIAVGSGREALGLLASPARGGHFDVLVCDIGMPDQDGYDVIRSVRASVEESRAIPAIAFTAYGRAQDRARALEAGFQTHIVKPVHPDELVVVIRGLLNRSGPRYASR
ncbi:MAG TPA: PAS domain S-box protein [Polyangia bacterium]|nr:PAS domain S-box protein [Polyangia bacterium]